MENPLSLSFGLVQPQRAGPCLHCSRVHDSGACWGQPFARRSDGASRFA